MIYKLSGKVIAKDGGKIAIEVGGIALEVLLPLSSYAQMPPLGENVQIYTHFILKEDGATLYGFISMNEKALFLQLITVSKIGPKLGLAILGNIGSEALISAIASQDVNRLSGVPGIGRKTAERIILELKDKLKGYSHIVSDTPKNVKDDVLSALCNLGYKQADCQQVLSKLSDKDFQVLLRKSLAQLSG